ncbi:MAG: HDIG domain-containing protein [Lentisphaeria bacterium]|nr:HDIG domain-containing protein [Lentisphaeria bacterium]
MFNFLMKSKLERQGYAGSLSRKRSKTVDLKDKPKNHWSLSFSFLLIWATSILSFYIIGHSTHSVPFVKGQIATHDVFAAYEFSFTCENDKLKKDSQINTVTPAFSINSKTVTQDLRKVGLFLTALESSKPSPDPDVSVLLKKLSTVQRTRLALFFKNPQANAFFKKRLYFYLSSGVANDTSVLTPYHAQNYSTVDHNNRVSTYSKANLLTKVNLSMRLVNDLNPGENDINEIAPLISRIVQGLVHSNLAYDAHLTKVTTKAPTAIQNTTYVSFSAGKRIIKKGDVVNQQQLLAWRWHEKAYQKNLKKEINVDLLEFAIISFIIILLILTYMVKNKYGVIKTKQLSLFFSVVISLNLVLIVGVYSVLTHFSINNYIDLNNENFMLILLPSMFAAMITALLVDRISGSVTGLLLCLIVALVFKFSIHDFSVLLVITIVSAFAVDKAKSRSAIMKGSFYSVLAGLVMLVPVMLTKGFPPISYLYLLGFAFIGFLLIFLLVMLLLPVLEFISGQTSNLTLLELCDLGHPLLVQMQIEAPGSYHHSLMVATIAEHAAKSIGANPLLARVCSYFHDIGKMVKSDYFTENNENSKEKHLDISAKMSTIVIQNHVKEGVNLAYKHKLKKPLIEAIEQHHGKSLVSFFYQVAKGQTGDKYTVEDSDFRYRGPNPSRKEIVIIAIADPCEAASRSLVKANYNSILALVSSIINSRFQDGMFAEAEITLKEMETIKLSIVHTLCSMKHTRISYPSDQNETKVVMEDSNNSSNEPTGSSNKETKVLNEDLTTQSDKESN